MMDRLIAIVACACLVLVLGGLGIMATFSRENWSAQYFDLGLDVAMTGLFASLILAAFALGHRAAKGRS